MKLDPGDRVEIQGEGELLKGGAQGTVVHKLPGNNVLVTFDNFAWAGPVIVSTEIIREVEP